jgi:hypothetical protein
MTILAAVNFGNKKLVQSWKLLEGEISEEVESKDFILVFVTENKKCVAIPLERSLIGEIEGNKFYLGTLDISTTIIL